MYALDTVIYIQLEALINGKAMHVMRFWWVCCYFFFQWELCGEKDANGTYISDVTVKIKEGNNEDLDIQKTVYILKVLSVNYIKKSAKDNSVTLRWFGGEPLCNSRAIDIICSELRKQGVVFTSSMVTNGYLFDVEAVQKDKKNWSYPLALVEAEIFVFKEEKKKER